AAEIKVVDSHNNASQRPLRNDAVAHFRLGTDCLGDGETAFFIFWIVDESTYMFFSNFVPVQKDRLGLRQAHAVVVTPIEQGKLVESIAVDRVVLGIDDPKRQFI